jgi:GTPase involved in cell partitioning and DNA repair
MATDAALRRPIRWHIAVFLAPALIVYTAIMILPLFGTLQLSLFRNIDQKQVFVGLGDRFLGHTERCRVLLHLVDGTQDDPAAAYKTVRAELEAYGNGLEDKPEIVALTKADALTPEAIKEQSAKLKKACGQTPLILSSASRQGVPDVLRALFKIIDEAREDAKESA